MKKDVLIYFDLVTSLKTTREVDDLALEIDTLMEQIYESEKMSLEKALTSISSAPAKKIRDIFEKNKLNIDDKKLVSDFLDTLKSLIRKFKVIKLILAFDPTRKTIEKIHGFISDNIGIGYILDIEVDESILGGATVAFNGKYKDHSMRKALDETFQNKREQILNVG